MKMPGLVLFAVLLNVSVLHPAIAAENVATSKHSLWMIAGKSNVVYLLGSVHLLKREHYPLATPIMAAFTNSQIAAFEADLEKMEDPVVQLKLLNQAKLPEGETLREHLTAETYRRFAGRVMETGLPEEAFNTFKPFVAAITLQMLELQKLGADPEFGVDKYFFKRAKAGGKQILALETVEFQIDLATNFSKSEGEMAMKSTLDDIDNTRKQFSEMITAWQRGDAASLEKLLNDALREAPTIYKRFLTDRNERWIPQIEKLLTGNKNAIVIVGAGHLVGADGVVELLRKRNFKVTH
jgi:uncharacterized protein